MAEKRASKYQKELCEALNRLRSAKPEFRDRGRFVRESGLANSTVEDIENCRITPTLPIIERWIEACGGSLKKFFITVYVDSVDAASRPSDGVGILHGYEHFYKLLNGIIKHGDPFWRNSIEGNLYGMYIATGLPLPDGVPGPPLQSERESKQEAFLGGQKDHAPPGNRVRKPRSAS